MRTQISATSKQTISTNSKYWVFETKTYSKAVFISTFLCTHFTPEH